MSMFRNLLMQQKGWSGKPADWSDIRKDCPANSIALYAGVKSDYSQYNNLGFAANCIGGYNVFIDGTQYGSTYASGSTCTITWSTSGITTGDDITTPSALKAHKIWISPATEGNNITKFRCARVAASGTEQQGVLWEHFNLSNSIDIGGNFNNDNMYNNKILLAVTAKNNKIKYSGTLYWSYQNCNMLEYLPILEQMSASAINANRAFADCSALKKLIIKNFKPSDFTSGGYGTTSLEKWNIQEWNLSSCNLFQFTPAANINVGNLDISTNNTITRFVLNGASNRFLSKFTGLMVSSEAPFNDATSPQINVSYTGMDRQALVQLFNDLPYNVGYEVVGSPTINNGILSDCVLDTSYIVTSSVLPNNISNMELHTEFTIFANSATGFQSIFMITGYPSLEMQYRQFRIYVRNSDGTSSSYTNQGSSITYNQPATLDFKFENGTTSYLVKQEGETKLDVSFPNTKISNANISFGNRWQALTNGSINLNNTYIKLNDVYWFRGQAAMTKTLSCVGATGNQDKLTIVGSPTIQDGVVSGFSDSDYLSINGSVELNKPFEIATKITTSSEIVPSKIIGLYPVTGRYGIVLYIKNNKFSIMMSHNGNGWEFDTDGLGSYEVLPNTTYYLKFYWDYNSYKLDYSLDGTNYINEHTINNNTSVVPTTRGFIGVYQDNINPFNGSIDLNETYIKVNNELWFGREQYLLPEDKNIALNKRWQLTLS